MPGPFELTNTHPASLTAVDHDHARMVDAVRCEVKVVEEYLVIQEAYDAGFVALDPTAEVHTRADRATLELRRMLADPVEAASAHEVRAPQPAQVAP